MIHLLIHSFISPVGKRIYFNLKKVVEGFLQLARFNSSVLQDTFKLLAVAFRELITFLKYISSLYFSFLNSYAPNNIKLLDFL